MVAPANRMSFLTIITLATAVTEGVVTLAENASVTVEPPGQSASEASVTPVTETVPSVAPAAPVVEPEPVNAIDGKVEVMTDDSHELLPHEPGEETLSGMLSASPVNSVYRRTKWQREVDLLDIAECMLKRMSVKGTLEQINGRLRTNNAPYTLSFAQIRNDGKEIHRRWTEEFVGGTARQRKAAELAFLDRIEREAWEVYSRSLRDEQSGSQITSGSAAEVAATTPADRTTGRSVNITKTVAKAQRDGEVGPLLLLLKISEHRAKLLGFANIAELNTEQGDQSKQQRLEAIRKAFTAKVLRDHAAKERETKMLADADSEAHAQPLKKVLQPA